MSKWILCALTIAMCATGCDSKENTETKEAEPTTSATTEPAQEAEKKDDVNTAEKTPEATGLTLKDFQKCLDLQNGTALEGQTNYTVKARDYFGKGDCLQGLNSTQMGAYMFGDYVRDPSILDDSSSVNLSFDEKTNVWTGTGIVAVLKGDNAKQHKKTMVVIPVGLVKGCESAGQLHIMSGLAVEKTPSTMEDMFAFMDGDMSPGMAARCEMSADKVFAHAMIDQQLNKDSLTMRLSHGPLDGPMKDHKLFALDGLPNSKKVNVSDWKL